MLLSNDASNCLCSHIKECDVNRRIMNDFSWMTSQESYSRKVPTAWLRTVRNKNESETYWEQNKLKCYQTKKLPDQFKLIFETLVFLTRHSCKISSHCSLLSACISDHFPNNCIFIEIIDKCERNQFGSCVICCKKIFPLNWKEPKQKLSSFLNWAGYLIAQLRSQ